MRNRTVTRRPRRHGGMAVLEMAVVLPVLLYLAMGMVEYGQFFYLKTAFQQAARDAARAALMPTARQADPAAAATRALAAAGVPFQSSWMTLTDTTPASWGGGAGGTVADCSTVAAGHTILVTITTSYGGLPGAVRPLSDLSMPAGIPAGRAIAGSSTGLKE